MVRRIPFRLLPGLHTPGHLGVSRFLGSSSPTKAKEVSLCSHLQPELRLVPLFYMTISEGGQFTQDCSPADLSFP